MPRNGDVPQNMEGYRLVERAGDELVFIHAARYGRQMWSRTAGPVRKDTTCRVCGRVVTKGSEPMYRPLTNGYNRMHRICCACVEGQTQGPAPAGPTWMVGDRALFRKSGREVKIVEIVEAGTAGPAGYTVERLDNGKQFFATGQGLDPLPAAEQEEHEPAVGTALEENDG